MSPPTPTVLRPEQLPEDLICSICMALPTHPLITPCDHIFCIECIHQALEMSNQCPIDRKPCTIPQLKPLQGCLSRIWGSTQVKCGNHQGGCAWTGSIGDYANHLDQCTSARNETESALQTEVETLKKRNAELEQNNAQLKAKLKSRVNLPSLFVGEYNYQRENVVQLSQLISRYLEDKPAEIDGNKIFDCIRNIVMDLKRDYDDNPQFYRMDVKMLLATCQASTWFSDRQRVNITTWYEEQF
mmetsp:Transcript_46460/g.97634  ORF Transcript_46460/g.97634 Transcript_46460/m.97634 type:complete len:243 (+) Transcript_46460:191-919(+)